MKKLLIVLILSTLSYALEAPYLISATALSDSSVQLQWRNNDAATTGFIVQRADQGSSNFIFIDSIKTATTLSYLDKKFLQQQVTYFYRLLAYNESSVSDYSDTLQVTTLAFAAIFKKSSFQLFWDFDTSKSIQVTIFDSSNCETGYRIYRNQDFSAAFKLVAQVISGIPEKKDTIRWFDSTISANQWYNYTVAAYKTNDSLFSNPCSTYTFRGSQPQRVTMIEKLSDFPISDSGSWSAQAGDSIILKETSSPKGKFTAINVKDSRNPTFAGYIDSTTLLSYPMKSLIPAFINFNVQNNNASTWSQVITYKDRILVFKDSLLKMYQVKNNIFSFIDSFQVAKYRDIYENDYMDRIILLNDTVLAVQCNHRNGIITQWIMYTFFPVYLANSGFVTMPACTLGRTVKSPPFVTCSYPYIHGILDRKIIISVDSSTSGERHHNLSFYDISSYRRTKFISAMLYNTPWNTGYYISPTENLCIYAPSYNSGFITELFISDIQNTQTYQTALLNKAIYSDTTLFANRLQNILLDTLNKRIFLIFQNNLTILRYYYDPTKIVNHPAPNASSSKGFIIRMLPTSSGFTIILPANGSVCNLFFYDLSGRLIDKMQGVTSNAVLWRPKTRSVGCYFVVVKSGGEKYVERFIVR